MRRAPWAPTFLLLTCAGAAVATVVPQGPLAAQRPRVRPYRPPQVPNCGGSTSGTVPRPNASGDRLYFRMVDAAGYDFEIWCISGVASVYYEYRISFPDGTWEKIDECELFWGSNVVVLHVEGDSVVSDTTPNGAPLRRLRGRIRRYYHNNFNSSKDFHTILDYGTGKVTRFDTRSVRDGNGNRFRELTGTSETTIDIPTPPRPPGTPGTSIAPVHGGTVVRSVAPDPAIPYCTAEDSDSLAIVEYGLSDGPDAPAAYSLGSAGIDSVWAEDGDVAAALRSGHPGGGVSLVVPREVGGTGRLARVSVDGAEVPSEQSVAGSLRTVTFAVPAGAGTVRIGSRAGGPFDWRLWLLVLLAVLLAWWLGRRRMTVLPSSPASAAER